MSTKIKLTTNLGGNKAGDTITVTRTVASYLTGRGHAEEVKARAPKKTEDE